jgi:hypothetical protein
MKGALLLLQLYYYVCVYVCSSTSTWHDKCLFYFIYYLKFEKKYWGWWIIISRRLVENHNAQKHHTSQTNKFAFSFEELMLRNFLDEQHPSWQSVLDESNAAEEHQRREKKKYIAEMNHQWQASNSIPRKHYS